MKNIKKIPVLGIILFCFICIVWLKETHEKTFNITGYVQNTLNHKPIEGATVKLWSTRSSRTYFCRDKHEPLEGKDCKGHTVPYAAPHIVQTDKKGAFIFHNIPKNIPKKTVYLEASKKNFSAWDDTSDKNTASSTYINNIYQGPITLQLSPMASITGTVWDEDHKPLKGVGVEMIEVSVESGKQLRQRRGPFEGDISPTNLDGIFQFNEIPPGNYYLIAYPLIQVPIDNTGYNEYPLWGHGQKGNWDNRDQKDLYPFRDDKGQTVGFVPIRYPTATEDNISPLLDIKEGKEILVNLQFKPVPFYHMDGVITGQTEEIPSGSFINVKDLDTKYIFSYFYHIDIDQKNNRFDIWLPDGEYCLTSNFDLSGNKFLGNLPITVRKSDLKLNFNLNDPRSARSCAEQSN
jgi:hypothetical protein